MEELDGASLMPTMSLDGIGTLAGCAGGFCKRYAENS